MMVFLYKRSQVGDKRMAENVKHNQTVGNLKQYLERFPDDAGVVVSGIGENYNNHDCQIARSFGRQKKNNTVEFVLGTSGMKTVKYDVWTLDVDENGIDVYPEYVADCFQTDVEFPTTHKVHNEGTPQEFSDDWPTKQQIIDVLIRIGCLDSGVSVDDFDIDGDPNYRIHVNESEHGSPLFHLEYPSLVKISNGIGGVDNYCL